MRIKEIITESDAWQKKSGKIGEAHIQELKQRLDPKCWKGKHKAGTKIKGGVRVNNCVPNESVAEGLEDFEGLQFKIAKADGQLFVNAFDPGWGNNELGYVIFDIDGKNLDPQDLFVKEKYRSQGIARIMYDYVKSKGYKIHRSWDQTDDGSGFWDKHRGKDVRVWEQGVAEAANAAQQAAIAVNMKKAGKKPKSK